LRVTQQVLAVAVLSDNTLWSAAAEIEVTVSSWRLRAGWQSARARAGAGGQRRDCRDPHPWSTTRTSRGFATTTWDARFRATSSRHSPAATNGREIFRARLHPAVSTNPYFMFYAVAKESGELVFTWTDDQGGVATHNRADYRDGLKKEPGYGL